jgi:mono/diheme cytochrome c family protein
MPTPASFRRSILPALAAFAAVAAGAPRDGRAATGAELYAQNCSMCHQADGAGLAGQYPPLKNRIDQIAATPEGKHYLADLLTHGMTGSIQAGGASYVGYMPAFKQLPDGDIASVLNWLSDQGGTKPPPHLEAADLAAARGRSLTAHAVLDERTALQAQHPLP